MERECNQKVAAVFQRQETGVGVKLQINAITSTSSYCSWLACLGGLIYDVLQTGSRTDQRNHARGMSCTVLWWQYLLPISERSFNVTTAAFPRGVLFTGAACSCVEKLPINGNWRRASETTERRLPLSVAAALLGHQRLELHCLLLFLVFFSVILFLSFSFLFLIYYIYRLPRNGKSIGRLHLQLHIKV